MSIILLPLVLGAVIVSLVSPSSSSWITSTPITFKFNVTNATTNSVSCSLYASFDAGSSGYTYNNSAWNKIVSVTGINGTNNNTLNPIRFPATNTSGFKWNVYCNAESWASSNRTNYIDLDTPTITVNSPSSASYTNSQNTTINATCVDKNLVNYTVRIYNSSGTSKANYSGTATNATSWAQPLNLSAQSGAGVYTIQVLCNDSASQSSSTSTLTRTYDSTAPTVSGISNSSKAGVAWWVAWNASETSTCTLEWATSNPPNITVTGTYSGQVCNASITLNKSYANTTLVINITSTDLSNNSNETSFNITTTYPIQGWVGLMLGQIMNLSDIATQSGADYVYAWNNSAQAFVDNVNNASNTLAIGDGVLLYDAAGTWWNRNNSGIGNYSIGLKSGWNLFGIGMSGLSMQNLTMNTSGNIDGVGARFNSSYTFFALVNNTNEGATINYYWNDSSYSNNSLPLGWVLWIYGYGTDTRDWGGT